MVLGLIIGLIVGTNVGIVVFSLLSANRQKRKD